MLFAVDFSNKLVYIPIAFCLWTVFGFLTTLGIAGSYDQVALPPFGWPSISSTGAYPPTSCIFSMVAVISGMLGYFVIYYFYKYIDAISKARKIDLASSWSTTLLIMGSVVCIGTAVVGCNQRPNIPILHALGAFAAFLVGAAYCGIVSYLTWSLSRQNQSSYPTWFVILRGTLAGLEILSVILMFAFSAKRSQGLSYATAGNVFEWLVMTFQCIFYATFCVEFSNIQLSDFKIGLTQTAKRHYKVEAVQDDRDGRNSFREFQVESFH